MLIIVRSKAEPVTLEKVAEDFAGYVKVVVDMERNILAAGGKRHIEGEEILLKDGSRQEDLWGGGLDLASGEIDFDSMINLRPRQNRSREVLSEGIRNQMEAIIRNLLK
ncbi:MAG: DUF5674 family protein [Planctomycetota bacterium]